MIVTYSREASHTHAEPAPHGADFILDGARDPDGAATEPAQAMGDRRIDGLCLNAGQATFAQPGQITSPEFDRQFASSSRRRCCRCRRWSAALRDGAPIRFTTATANRMGAPGTAIYAAAKGAARSRVRVRARELAPNRITVIGLGPRPIETGSGERSCMDAEAQTRFRDKIAAKVPLGRLGTADKAAAVAEFLLLGEARFKTSPEHSVDGGVTEL